MANNDIVLETQNLTKQFSSLTAVDNVSWQLNKGDTKGILGPNGAGKSTFFNCITGVLKPTSGAVKFKDEDITGMAAHKIAGKGIAKTFQTTNLFNELTVFENVRVAAQVLETTFNMTSRAEDLTGVRDRAAEIIDRVGLTAIEDRVINELSHGDQRRVEIAVALATEPDVILFDEPMSGVSSGEMEELRGLFEELLDDPELTFVLIEHNVGFLLDIADIVTVLHEGSILIEDDPDKITSDEQVQRVYLE